ncbi:hypothetical protein [Nocardia xishanensis]
MTISEFIRARIRDDEHAVPEVADPDSSTRALREVQSKQQLFALALRVSDAHLGDGLLLGLAHVWAGHKDFQAEWAL